MHGISSLGNSYHYLRMMKYDEHVGTAESLLVVCGQYRGKGAEAGGGEPVSHFAHGEHVSVIHVPDLK